MKSIMQEDSSIAKAIEKAWIKAEKPQSFSIKILEEPERNFFGITVKSAKIAFFFDEVEPKKGTYSKHEKRETKPTHYKPLKEAESHQEKIQKIAQKIDEPKADVPAEKKVSSTEPAPRSSRSRWSSTLVGDAEKWIRDILHHMGKSDQQFSTKVKNNNIIFTFEKPVLENSDQERLLFSSFAHLLSQSLKNKFKHEARGLKIILQSN